MKTKSSGFMAALLAIAGLLAIGAPAAQAGWIQTVGGTYDYLSTANWDSGTINDDFPATLTLAGSQTLTFGANRTTPGAMDFLYGGNYAIQLRGEGGNRTLTLGGDVTLDTPGGSSANLTIGSTTDGQYLDVNLGGATRTFTVRSGRAIDLRNTVSNGSMIVAGNGGVVRISQVTGSAPTVDFTVEQGSRLDFDSTTAGVTGLTRAKSVTLQAGNLTVRGNNTANSVDTVTGAVTAGAYANLGGINYVTLTPNSARNTRLSAGSLARANGGVVLFRGTNLGANTIASQTANNANIEFTTAPTLVGGGGGAGSTTISILPWALGGTTTSDAGSTFVTYTAANGVRPLDTTTEYATSITDGSSTTNNVRLSGGGTVATIDNATTINSLYVVANASATNVNGSGTLTVTSGAVFIGANATTTINANLNFGTAQGVIGFTRGKNSTLNGAVSGSGGLVFYQPTDQPATMGSSGTGMTISGNAGSSTYTGDTIIHGRIKVPTGFLPSGSRTGDVYVYGGLVFGGTATINGLYGDGLVRRENSGAATLTIGDNNANGDFGGVIYDFGALSLVKTGNGTQILSGENTYTGATTINAGKLQVDGSITSAVTVNSTGTLGGSGTVGNVTVNDGGHLAPGSSPGTLNTGTLVLSAASVLDFELASLTGPSDKIAVTGDLTLDGVLNVTALTGFQAGQYTLLTYTGSLTDNGLSPGTMPGAFTYGIDTGTSGSVILNVIPEPATMAILALGGLGVLMRKRRT